ncbi:hypothetical protein [Micromonospora cathayae]|uniref:Uncharacterized protein n=1 Tax=Micromonospora cathayae TaxID=3028804 RepID=A0ABY7ZR66_9ACTN|nr:hypothetical protein [Micromonospora sp. HUAS 3]WDZ84911.1 hypothetical protein PVK37_00055 [Micromonospora sp. HUAS 3]
MASDERRGRDAQEETTEEESTAQLLSLRWVVILLAGTGIGTTVGPAGEGYIAGLSVGIAVVALLHKIVR